MLGAIVEHIHGHCRGIVISLDGECAWVRWHGESDLGYVPLRLLKERTVRAVA